ncbi:MAG: carbon-nitrogen family hydrolase [candidate division KSB1 bacterium]|nr:carbon-nitrogen family hydrolase [candidate division KSB1 bacterium]MDZ7333709.1 carbon-nitrogen family hydrolase [candidate division KSB1 bacterium]MDZ7356157.1 carbon-nitrogen family hydrolase [candidate division KSB1 bacterium]MDZ7398865.1 carbon-nitrogen family hydrolase [candidate division KSB1 bacterium]
MRIAVAQIKCSLGDPLSNLEQIAALTQNAAEKGCHVIVFPEMVDTGYEMSVVREKASSWNDAPFQTIQNIAEQHKIHVIAGISEKEGERIYNSIAAFGPRGEFIGKYRKAHLAAYPPLDEDSCISPGDSLSLFTIGSMTWGFMICYDLRFPELSRSLVLKGAEVLVLCSAWPFPRVGHWDILTRARAIENQVYLIAANRVGNDGMVTFCGSSRIIDPYGVIVASAAEDREALLIGEINRDNLMAVRNKMPIFQHRRPELYQVN